MNWRWVVVRLLTAIYALFWLNVAFSAGSVDDQHRLEELAFRTLFAIVLVILPLVLLLRRPEQKIAGQQQMIAMPTAHALATFVAAYVDPLAYALVIYAIVLALLYPRHESSLFAGNPGWTHVAAASVVAVPLLAVAIGDAQQLRHGGSSYSEDALVFELGLILAVLIGAARAPGWRIPTWTGAVALGLYGVASMLNPERASTWGRSWGAAAAVGAIALVAVAEWTARPGSTYELPAPFR